MIRAMILIAALSLTAFAPPQSTARFTRPEGHATLAASILEPIATLQKPGKDISQEHLLTMRETIENARKHLATQSPAGERLSKVLQSSKNAQPKVAAADLQRAARDVHDMLAFRPIAEAELPKGFPSFTGVGVIEVKQYPVYRKAVAKKFGTLFRHITANGISMTTPVEMKMAETPKGELAQESMAFLYGSTEIGEPGTDGSVQVLDTESIKVVSMGLRGPRRREVVADAARRLKRWLNANPQYEAAGVLRVMGYNSPFVPRAEQYFEVQLPLREAPADQSKPAAAPQP